MIDAEALHQVQQMVEQQQLSPEPWDALRRVLTLATASVALQQTVQSQEHELAALRLHLQHLLDRSDRPGA